MKWKRSKKGENSKKSCDETCDETENGKNSLNASNSSENNSNYDVTEDGINDNELQS